MFGMAVVAFGGEEITRFHPGHAVHAFTVGFKNFFMAVAAIHRTHGHGVFFSLFHVRFLMAGNTAVFRMDGVFEYLVINLQIDGFAVTLHCEVRITVAFHAVFVAKGKDR